MPQARVTRLSDRITKRRQARSHDRAVALGLRILDTLGNTEEAGVCVLGLHLALEGVLRRVRAQADPVQAAALDLWARDVASRLTQTERAEAAGS